MERPDINNEDNAAMKAADSWDNILIRTTFTHHPLFLTQENVSNNKHIDYHDIVSCALPKGNEWKTDRNMNEMEFRVDAH